MADHSSIEWTDATWNPVTGCTKISQGCVNCYAERFAERFRGVKGHPYEQGFDLRLWPERLEQPLRWTRPRRIFVNSMSDLFHSEIPREFTSRVFEVMDQANWHIFQVLTKRAEAMKEFVNSRYSGCTALEHIHIGVSVENKTTLFRADDLRDTRASVRFLSCEPLLESLGNLDLRGIHWVIVGGESGPGYRPIDPAWVREIRDQCISAGIPFFFKQWGGLRPKSGGKLLDGVAWAQYPDNTLAAV